MINYAANLTKAGEYQLAITQYNEVLHSDPYNGCALYGMANVLIKQDNMKKPKRIMV